MTEPWMIFCLVWYFAAKTGNFPLKDVPFLDLIRMSMSTVSFLTQLDSEFSAYRMLSFYLWSYLSGFKSRINKHLLTVCSFDIAPFPWVKFIIFGQFFPDISIFSSDTFCPLVPTLARCLKFKRRRKLMFLIWSYVLKSVKIYQLNPISW